MTRAIITGASGFIGSWLAFELIENNYDVTLLVRDKRKLLPELQKKCHVIEKQFEDINNDDFSGKSSDLMFHLAWQGVAATDKNNLDLQLHNIKTSLNLLNVASEIGCNAFIAAGSVAEYALCDKVMDFKERQCPNDFYGAAKVSSSYFLKIRAQQLAMPLIWTIVPSTYGERRSDANILTYTIKTLLRKSKPSYGNLNQMWDFMYVKDVVRALRLIGEKGLKNKIYGIGSGVYRPLKDYITIIRDIIDPDLELGIGEIKSQSKSAFSSCVNNYDLIKDTGFLPRYTFREGITRTIEYYRDSLVT